MAEGLSRVTCRLRCAAILGAASLLLEASAPAVSATMADDAIAAVEGRVQLGTYQRHLERLASDEFAGRKPATSGETRTVTYLIDEFRRLGLAPGVPHVAGPMAAGEPMGSAEASYEQRVPIIEHTFASDSALRVGNRVLRLPEDAVIGTRRVVGESSVRDAAVVFAGYGVVAPEYGWNDYAGIDVRGRTVIVLINDPGFASGDPSLFHGRTMTYYGRWTYKFEEAARQGAAAVLIVHETDPAAYPWEVVQNGWTGPQLGLETADGNAGRTAIEGWITRDSAEALFRDAGGDFALAKAAAGRKGFRAQPLGNLAASATVRTAVRRSQSSNVLALLRGSERPDEVVIYCAHWDHLGMALSGTDRVFNGAVDNATGVAGLLAIAEAMSSSGRPPRRSILFLAVTAEEAGLLGSEYYATHPVVPLARTVAVLNMDAIAFGGPTRDVTVVGIGNSELDRYLQRAAARQQRMLRPEPTPEKGFFFRSDNFSFAKVGVPALYIKLGVENLELGAIAGQARDDDYYATRYHKVADQYRPGIDDLRGGLLDLRLLHAVGRQLATERGFPAWSRGSEFRAVRERSLRAR